MVDEAVPVGDASDVTAVAGDGAFVGKVHRTMVGKALTARGRVDFDFECEGHARLARQSGAEPYRNEKGVVHGSGRRFQQKVVVPRAVGQVVTQDDAGTGRWWRRRSMKPDSICTHTEWLEGARTRAGNRIANGEGIRTGFD